MYQWKDKKPLGRYLHHTLFPKKRFSGSKVSLIPETKIVSPHDFVAS